MLTRRTAICSIFAAPLLANAAMAGMRRVYAVDGWAIEGIDPVAYFRDHAAVPGLRAQAIGWRGAHWCFKSAANREAFERDPHAFAPRYGGYCALALVQGVLTPSDPQAWTIEGGTLFLNSSIADRAAWLSDPARHIVQADAHWARMMNA